MTLNENIQKYNELQEEIARLQEQLSEYKTNIVNEMKEKSLTKTSTEDGLTAQLVFKDNFKYVDERAMINYLKEKGLTDLITEKINTTSMNKELKKGLSLTEDLKTMYTKNTTEVLSVKRA